MRIRSLRGVALALLLFAAPDPGSAQSSSPRAAQNNLDSIYEFAAGALSAAIQAARDEIAATDTKSIPPAMRRRLISVFPGELLDRVRYRVTDDGSLGLQAFQYGEVQAMTLIDVIVFRSERDALTDDALWAHELTHVKQYDRWGVEEFARRYVRNYKAVEDEAYGFEAAYEKRKAALK